MSARDLQRAARLGEPSYVWRDGQERRLDLILEAAGDRAAGRVLDNGCGVGQYLARLDEQAACSVGVEYDLERAHQSHTLLANIACAAGECLPFADDHFDLILSHEVLEHVNDDRRSMEEIVRVCRPGGRIVVFVPNRGYPFETHGIYWRGQYHFGNYPLVNYLPAALRSLLAPHVRSYTGRNLGALLDGLPVAIMQHSVLFAAYDNFIARWPTIGRTLRWLSQRLEATPLRALGLSRLLVLEKNGGLGPDRSPNV